MPMASLKICALCFWLCGALAHYHASKEDNLQWRQRFLPNKPTITTTSAPMTKDNEISYEKLRHHSRFPNLDRVMVKIDGMHQKTPITNKVRHDGSAAYRTTTVKTTTTTTTDDDLFEDYGDLVDEDEDENDDDDEWENDDASNDENYEDDETLDNEESPFYDDDNNDSEWQAEEATEPPVQASISSFAKYKWDNYGTRARVEESRRQQLHIKTTSEQQATYAVVEHYMKVRLEGQCRKPLPKVIPVQNVHPDPSKTYTPHCTILHRCAEDTGCCTNYETRCGPKKQVPVHLYFYAKTLGSPETKVERLTFYNHTECECIPKLKNSSENSGLSFKSGHLYPENIRRCKCPEEFTARYRYDSRCTCDCEEHNQDCIRRKKGKEFFSMKDRLCISGKQCGPPLCEYGVYVRHEGRCQRKQEKLDTYTKLTIN